LRTVKVMNRIAAAVLLVLVCGSAGAKEKPARPKILGIAAAHFYSTDVPAARKFYQLILHPTEPCSWCKQTGTAPILITLPSGQKVTFTPAPVPAPKDLLWEVTLATDNVKAMKEYLKANGGSIEKSVKGDGAAFTIKDSEGHRLGFQQVSAGWSPSNTDALRMMHAGFIFNDRSGADHFYKDILGFHTYWHGGRDEAKDDWVAMQVPDGTDWIEYMLNISPMANKHTIGVMNHMALGVVDIHDTEKRLIADGWKPTEQPKVGRDGKWQLNLYDPDETRTEFMEFTPKEKPCCSEFNGTHPGPK
jgi:predicted enzyme related to lactoylglutathione lyase/catechol 2,3-dioxygenase-like lactoylglutathione lyase family enzyme